MRKQKTDLHAKVREILGHNLPLPPEASSPMKHFEKNANSILKMLEYIERHFEDSKSYQAVYDRHLGNLRRMALSSLVEAFERFLKELAALCVDSLSLLVNDDRFDEFSVKGSQSVFHFSAGSIGKALCESDTWLSNKTTNEKFRRLLKEPFGNPWENLFPDGNQPPQEHREQARTLSILWQVRPTITHNVGVVTGSDAAKFRMLVKADVDSEKLLRPLEDDILHAKRFLFETADSVNHRVGDRLAVLSTKLHADNPSLFDPRERADALSTSLGYSVKVGDCQGAA